jgi:hypothetical protein
VLRSGLSSRNIGISDIYKKTIQGFFHTHASIQLITGITLKLRSDCEHDIQQTQNRIIYYPAPQFLDNGAFKSIESTMMAEGCTLLLCN